MDSSPGDHLAAVVLAALEEGPAHGYLIARRVSSWTEGSLRIREGSLYPLLRGLEVDGLVEGRSERSGERVRRVYRLTESGLTRLAAERRRFREDVRVISRVLLRAGEAASV